MTELISIPQALGDISSLMVRSWISMHMHVKSYPSEYRPPVNIYLGVEVLIHLQRDVLYVGVERGSSVVRLHQDR